MAKKSMIQSNLMRVRKSKLYSDRRAALKKIIYDKNAKLSDRFEASMKLAALPRNSSKTRIRNRCRVTGRPRGYYRKFEMSRICIRAFGEKGELPGLIKASW